MGLIHDLPTVISATAAPGQTVFSYPFKAFSIDDFDVSVDDVPAVYNAVPVGPLQYKVQFGADEGGEIVFGAPAVGGEIILIVSDIPIERVTQFPNTGPVPMSDVNLELNRHIRIMQDLDDGLGRTIQIPPGEEGPLVLPPEDERAQGILGFDANGDPIILPSEELGSVAVMAQRIEYVAIAGQTVFATPSTYTVGYLSVFVNGVKLSASEFVAIDGSVAVLNEPAVAGDIVALEGFLGSGTASDAANISFIQSGIGAFTRNAQDKMRDVAHVFDYLPPAIHAGVVAGSNLDDLTDEINAILTYHPRIMLPTVGTLNILGQLLVPSGGGIIGGGGRSIIRALGGRLDRALIRNANPLPVDAASRDKGLIFRDFKIDGNKAANTQPLPIPPNAQYQYQHGIQMNAVDGVDLNVWIVNCQGDGVIFAYARSLDEASTNFGLGCRGMTGTIRTDNCYRQGVAMTCGEQFNLAVIATGAGWYGFDIEPDQGVSYARDGFIRLVAKGCGVNDNFGGGIAIGGTASDNLSAADVRNIIADVDVRDCKGTGIYVRDADVVFRGQLLNNVGTGINGFYAVAAAFGASNVSADLTIGGYTVPVRSSAPGNVINGRFWSQGGTVGGQFDNCAGGNINFRASTTGNALLLASSNNMIFPNAVLISSGSNGVLLNGTSSGNRFPNLTSQAGGTTFQAAFAEAGSANDNRCTNARLSGGVSAAVKAIIVGATSRAECEPVTYKATAFTPPNVPAASQATFDLTGAIGGGPALVVGPTDLFDLTFSLSLGGLQLSAYWHTTNTVRALLQNNTAAPIALAALTYRLTVTQRFMAP